jgi:hypothetical protein
MGVSEAAYDKMSQAEQAAFYGKWLKHYDFEGKMRGAGIDFKSLPPARQAAVLQAFQFAPNGNWIGRLGHGDDKSAVTDTKQARPLGSTSIADMESYFARQMPSAKAGTYTNTGRVSVASADDSIPQSAGLQSLTGGPVAKPASGITAERYTPPKSESGIAQNHNREWYRLKGSPEEKARSCARSWPPASRTSCTS